MKLTSPSGREFNLKNPNKYRIKWGAKSLSKFQFGVKRFLKPYWEQHIVFEEFPIPQTRMSLDFFNFSMNVAVEVQGAQHLKYNKHFHGNTNYKYLTQLKRDQYKFDFCEKYGIILVEIYPDDILSEELFEKQGIVL